MLHAFYYTIVPPMALYIGVVHIIAPNCSNDIFSGNIISDPISVRLMESFNFSDIKSQIHQVTAINREIVEICYRKPYLNSNGLLLYAEMKIRTDEDVREMFANFLFFI